MEFELSSSAICCDRTKGNVVQRCIYEFPCRGKPQRISLPWADTYRLTCPRQELAMAWELLLPIPQKQGLQAQMEGLYYR